MMMMEKWRRRKQWQVKPSPLYFKQNLNILPQIKNWALFDPKETWKFTSGQDYNDNEQDYDDDNNENDDYDDGDNSKNDDDDNDGDHLQSSGTTSRE